MPTFVLTNRNDRFTGTPIRDDIFARRGNDTVNGGFGDDFIFGELGNDILSGGFGNDTLNGGFGNDRLFGQDGSDTYVGGVGSDVFGFALNRFTTSSSFDTVIDYQQFQDRIALGRERLAIYDFLDDNNDGVLDAADDNVFDDGNNLELSLSGFTAAGSQTLEVRNVETLFFSDFIA